MRRIIATLAIALVLAACGNASRPVGDSVAIPTDDLACCGNATKPVGDPVPLLTDDLLCYAGGESGVTDTLKADATYGTSFAGRAVMWPTGYTAVRGSDGEVSVLDRSGAVRAVTGRKYHISVAFSRSVLESSGTAYVAAVECPYPWDFIDCTANPTSEYGCKPGGYR